MLQNKYSSSNIFFPQPNGSHFRVCTPTLEACSMQSQFDLPQETDGLIFNHRESRKDIVLYIHKTNFGNRED